jgi:hypothetical protein
MNINMDFFGIVEDDDVLDVTPQQFQTEPIHIVNESNQDLNDVFYAKDSYVKKAIRSLMAEHGILRIHTLFREVLEEDYQVLRNLVGGVNEVVIKEEKVMEPVSVVPSVEKAKPIAKAKVKVKEVKETKMKEVKVKETKVKEEKPKKKVVVEEKEKKNEIMEEDFIDSLVPKKITNQTQVFVTKLREGEDIDNVPSNLTTRELREWQYAQEITKSDELLHQGIDPNSLLTQANLKKWVEEEKKSYSYIARRLVGLPETQVAAEAKKYGIVSEVAKRRAAIIAARKK